MMVLLSREHGYLWCMVAVSLILVLGPRAAFTAGVEGEGVVKGEGVVEGEGIVEGEGAIVRNNQAAARKRAVQDALRKALEREVAALIDPFVQAENLQQLETRLYARTLTYIRSYRVLWEYPDPSQHVYRVGIEAEIATDDVAREIQALGLTPQGEEWERLLVLMVEDHLGRRHVSTFGRNGGVVARVLRTQLQAQGFLTVSLQGKSPWDGRDNSALEAGKRAGAGVVLIGQANAQKVPGEVAGMALQAIQARVRIQVLRTATGEQLALEQAESTAFHADAILGATQALEKAATVVAARIALPLRTYQQQYQKQVILPPHVP